MMYAPIFSPARMFTALALLAAGVLYLYFGASVGFLSDDFILKHNAATGSIWAPLEAGHHAPLVRLLLKLAGQGQLSAFGVLLISLAGHALNIFLAWRILRQLWPATENRSIVTGVALLFAINAPGVEAVVWRCAVGYVLVAAPLLGALWAGIAFARGRLGLISATLLFALFQAWALLAWDWGALTTPMLGVTLLWACIFRQRPAPRLQFSRMFAALLAPMAVLGLAMMLKAGHGVDAGYRINAPLTVLKLLFVAPAYTLVPLAPTGTLAAKAVTAFLAVGMWALLGVSAWKSNTARLFVALYVLFLLPAVLLSAIQLRYLYLPCLFFYGAVFPALGMLPKERINRILPALAVISLAMTFSQLVLWNRAYEASQGLLQEIATAKRESEKPLLLVNVPDVYGPQWLLFSPFTWRNGLESALGFTPQRAYTPDSWFTDWPNKPGAFIAPMPEICARFPDNAVYEILPPHAPHTGNTGGYALTPQCRAEAQS